MKAIIIIILSMALTSHLKAQSQSQDTAKTAVVVKPSILKSYKGEYVLRAELIIEVSLEEGILYFKAPRETRKVKLIPKNDFQFFNEINSAVIKFNSDENNQVISLTVINEVGRKITAAKR